MQKIEGLRDIKGIVEVTDYSLWWFLGIVALILIVAGVAVWRLRPVRKKRRFRKTAHQLAKERIEAIDYSDPKRVAYTFIEDVGMFVDENNRSSYDALCKALEPYKYKKEVPALDEGLKKQIAQFIREIKWQV